MVTYRKIRMPIAVKRNVIEAEDIHGIMYRLPCYYVFVFRKEMPIILFYLSKGIKYTMDYLNVSDIVSFIEKLPEEESVLKSHLFFPLSSKCYLQVDKDLFYKYPYIQSIVGAFATVCTNRITINQLDDPRQWIKRIANPNNYEKGYGILKYFNRLLDKCLVQVKPF